MKRGLVDRHGKLSIRKQCSLLGICRGGLYYKPIGESSQNLEMMRLMDGHILKEPTAGVISMQDMLDEQGYKAGYERVRRLMRKAGIYPIYPKPKLSKLGNAKYIHPYLLRDLEVSKPNQVWAIDITYVPMEQGFMYLTAIIDVFSRYIVGWGISNSLDAESSLRVVRQAVSAHGKPEILNSDQGSQFTCADYVEYLDKEKIRISMDGKGRAIDNIYIERFWRTIKYQHIYLRPASDGVELYWGIEKWLEKYHQRRHQGINRIKPVDKYFRAA